MGENFSKNRKKMSEKNWEKQVIFFVFENGKH